MAMDHYIQVSFQIPYKTHQAVMKLAAEYGLSKGNALMRLVEEGIKSQGELLEITTTNPDGVRHAHGAAKFLNNGLRKML